MTEPRLIDERYELDSLTGQGGMADIYRGRDRRLQREVAVKVLRADRAEDPEFRERFRREARAAASLKHRAVVSVYDTGETVVDGATVPYMVMEYVAGRTLRERLDEEGPLAPACGLELVDSLLGAVEYSHGCGIVHRDVKPANVMVTPSGDVKVMDFGIARAVQNAPTTLTATAQVLGTAQYLSPEQASGARVDVRSDLYSTGCVLYEALVGHPPFRGDSPVSLAYQHAREQPTPPSQTDPTVPAWADPLVLKAMAKDPDSRYQTATEMRVDVQRALAGQPVAAAKTPPARGPRANSSGAGHRSRQEEPAPPGRGRSKRGRRWVLALAPLTLVLLIGGAGGWALIWGPLAHDSTAVEVPRVIGFHEQAARSMLRNDGFKVNVVERFSDQQDKGSVVQQRPQPNSTSRERSTATIIVSKGHATVAVPGDLLDTTRSEAARVLQDASLRVGQVSRQPSARQPPGNVLSSDPSPGAAMQRGSAVDLTISTGPANVTVPPVVGTTAENARSILHERGFDVDTRYETRARKPEGTVLSLSPAGGTEAERGSRVTISVARAPDQSAKPSPSLTGSTPSPPRDGEDASDDNMLDDLFD